MKTPNKPRTGCPACDYGKALISKPPFTECPSCGSFIIPRPQKSSLSTFLRQEAERSEQFANEWNAGYANTPAENFRKGMVFAFQRVEKFTAESGVVSENASISNEVENLLINIAQILDVVKGEWGKEWSPFDQEQRDQITKLLTVKHQSCK